MDSKRTPEDGEPARNLAADPSGKADEKMTNIAMKVHGTDQRPVSVVGWTLAAATGAALWYLLYRLVI